MDRLDVERLLAVPALRILLGVLGAAEGARRDDLRELAGVMVGRPRLPDHWLTSWTMVGDAYASMMATVSPAPS